jgi:peptidoglycan/xylan/chitin deacetylase (PgdA/CDA1 family)
MSRDIPILMYHHVCPEPNAARHYPWAVTPDLFREQMLRLRTGGYESVHLSALLPVPAVSTGKQVVITFDDGALNLLEYAVPILQEYRLTATFFVPTRLLGARNSWDANSDYPREELMSPSEVYALHAAGFEIGSHGANHVNLSRVASEIAMQEMQESKSDLESLLGKPVRFLAYPFGEYPPEYAELCRKAGYDGACAISSHTVRVLDDPFALRRILIYDKDRGWRFWFKLTSFYLRRCSRRDRRQTMAQGTT